MKSDVIGGLTLCGLLVLALVTMLDLGLREVNNSKSYLQRRFHLTGLELSLLGLYLLFIAAIGLLLAYFGTLLIIDKHVPGIFFIVIGLAFTIDFTLFINHVLHELLQTIDIDISTGILTTKRFGKITQIDLLDEATHLNKYLPNDKTYTRRDVRLTGARFGKSTLISHDAKITISALRRVHRKQISDFISNSRIKTIQRQINYIL